MYNKIVKFNYISFCYHKKTEHI